MRHRAAVGSSAITAFVFFCFFILSTKHLFNANVNVPVARFRFSARVFAHKVFAVWSFFKFFLLCSDLTFTFTLPLLAFVSGI